MAQNGAVYYTYLHIMRLLVLYILFLGCQYCQSKNKIIISKQNLTLSVVTETNDTVYRTSVGVGVNFGNKTVRGDMKTPEGSFRIKSIERSSTWTHDFKDGQGQRKGAYSPYFIRLKIPYFNSIGIHGTCFPKSIGKRCSEGCVRLRNEDLLKLMKYIFVGMQVVIEPDILNKR